jgi:hypothetical protein
MDPTPADTSRAPPFRFHSVVLDISGGLRIAFIGEGGSSRRSRPRSAAPRQKAVLRGLLPMIRQISPASCGVSVQALDAVQLLQEMKEHLIADFGFHDIKLAGDAHINRTTEPVVRFLAWLKETPEAQAALRLILQRVASKH